MDETLKLVFVLLGILIGGALFITGAIFIGPLVIVGVVGYKALDWYLNRKPKTVENELEPEKENFSRLSHAFHAGLRATERSDVNDITIISVLKTYDTFYKNELPNLNTYRAHEIFFRTLERISTVFIKHLPRAAFSDAEAQGFIFPLDTLPDNPAEYISQLVQPIYDSEVKAEHLFAASRSQIRKNENAAGSPLKFRGTQDEFVNTYLAGTNFIELLSAPIPFSLTAFKKKHWAIYGRTGHGKTQLLQTLILAHLKEPDPPPMIIIDSQGQMLRAIEQLAVWDTLKDRLVVVDAQAANPPALNICDSSHRGSPDRGHQAL